MRKRSWQPLLWSALYVLLLLSFLTPFNIITINLVMVPAIVLFMKLDGRRFAFAYAAIMAVLLLIAGNVGLVLLTVAVFFLPPVALMGYFYKKRAARTAIIAGILAILGELIAVLAISYMFGGNPISQFEAYIEDTVSLLPQVAREMLPENFAAAVVKMIPLFMFSFAVYYIILSHAIARLVQRRSNEPLPGLPPLRSWKLPKSMVWYFLIAVVLDYVINTNADTTIAMIVVNLFPLLTVAFAVQAVSFCAYIAHVKKWGRALPIAAVVLMVIVTPALYLFSLLGLLDVVFPLRERIAGKS